MIYKLSRFALFSLSFLTFTCTRCKVGIKAIINIFVMVNLSLFWKREMPKKLPRRNNNSFYFCTVCNYDVGRQKYHARKKNIHVLQRKLIWKGHRFLHIISFWRSSFLLLEYTAVGNWKRFWTFHNLCFILGQFCSFGKFSPNQKSLCIREIFGIFRVQFSPLWYFVPFLVHLVYHFILWKNCVYYLFSSTSCNFLVFYGFHFTPF